MIYEEIMYGVKCDRCHEIYENSDGCTVSSDKYDMEEEACENDWQEIDGRHYCPDCYTRDENDEDKIIVKPLIHYSFFKFQSLVNQLTGAIIVCRKMIHILFYGIITATSVWIIPGLQSCAR